ncbi:anti-sigma factor domain-containing protein [Ruminiclostridium papyrosolvens]|uniref:RsgI N-terminal anti-sigma domain-containing protein n=1 Tax=Ruminiclostridium papyrosolvens C7 TaxID=1330534 RepID=U4R5M4_9FIRM|nr:anti-sigma factor domain-containing protein [Ruminiclostridium papyrosolvens]EPR13345.1 hypothetical protein L323_05590 [Ruminiclostridium papyrosolvens C7]
MGNNTGMILEFKGNKAIVMTSTCDFITITKMPEMFVGQQLDLSNSVLPRKFNPMRYFAIAGMFVLILCSVLIYHLVQPSSVFAYVDVDINPSIELSIDKKANVIEVKALNSDAAALVKNIKLVNKSLTSAVRIIIEESESKGFIRPDTKNAVLISASIKSGSEKVLDGIVSELQKTDFRVGSESIKAEVIKVDPTKRSEAVKNNISMGLYKLFEEISESGDDINIEKAKSENLFNIIESYEAIKQNKTTSDKNKYNSYQPIQDNEKALGMSEESTFKDTPMVQDNKKPENSNSKNYSNGKTNNSISSAEKLDKAQERPKESPDKKETFSQGSKPIPSEYGKKAPDANNNGKPKNNSSSEKKEENRNSNHNEKGKNKK